MYIHVHVQCIYNVHVYTFGVHVCACAIKASDGSLFSVSLFLYAFVVFYTRDFSCTCTCIVKTMLTF